MNSSNSNLLLSSSYQNNSVKRSVFKETEESVGNCKKIKPNFQEDINNVLQASHGYMTRHKLKQKLLASNQFKTNVSLGTSHEKDKSIIQPIKTTKKKKKKSTITYKKKVQLSYDNNVFGTNISLIKTSFKKEKSIIQPRKSIKIKKPSITYKAKSKLDFTLNNFPLVEKQTNTRLQNKPLLFESDSDLEIDYFQINQSKVNEKLASSPEIEDIRPVFNKNAEIKTYYNRKSNICTWQTKATNDAIGNLLKSEESNFLEKMNDCSIFQNKINSNINTTDIMTYQNICDTIEHEDNRKLDISTNSIKNHDSFPNEKLNFKLVKSNNSAYLQLGPKCCCRELFHFNKDANKISTSKTKHFVFDNDKKICQTFLQQKQLEANILKQLIENNGSIIQSERHVPNLNSTLFNESHNILIGVDENNHIEPYILKILKDFYVDVEYLSDCFDSDSSDDELKGSINSNIKNNYEASIPKDNLTFIKDDNFFTSNIKTLNKPSDTDKLSKDIFKKLGYNKSESIISKEEAIDNPKSRMEKKVNLSSMKKNNGAIKTTKHGVDIKKAQNYVNKKKSNVTIPKTTIHKPEHSKNNTSSLFDVSEHETKSDSRIDLGNANVNKNKSNVTVPKTTIHKPEHSKNNTSSLFDVSEHETKSDSRIDLGNANVNKKKSNVTIPKTTIHKPEPSKNNTSSLFDISEHETESDSSIDLANAYVNKNKSNVTVPKTTIHKPEHSKNNTSSLFDVSEHETKSDSRIDLGNANVNKNKSNVTVPKTTIHKPEHSKNNTSSLFDVSEHETKSDSRIDLCNANVNKKKSNVTIPKTTIHKPEPSKNNTSSLFDISEHETESDSSIDLANAYVNKNKSNVTVPKTTIHKPEHSKNNTSSLFDVSEHETKSDSRIDLGNANVNKKKSNVTIPKTTIHKPEPSKNNTSSLFDISEHETESDSSIDLANAYVNKKKSNVTIPKTTIHKPEPSKNNTSSLFDISEHETESDSSIDLANAYVNKNKSNVTVPKTTIHKPEHSKNNTSSLFDVSEHETKSDSRIDLGNANVNKKKSNVTIPKTTIHKPEPSKNNTSSLFDISEHETESDSSIDLANAYVNKNKSNVTVPKTTIHKPEHSKNNTSSLFDVSEHETKSDSSIDLANAYVNKNKSNVTVPKTTIHKPEHSKNNTSSLFDVSEHETKSDSRIDLGNANVNKKKSNVTIPKTTIHKPEPSKNNTSSLFDISEHETESDSSIDLANAYVNKNKSNVTVPKTTIHKPEHSKNNTSSLFDVSEHETKSDSSIDLANAYVNKNKSNVTVPKTTIHKPEHSKNNTSSLFDVSEHETKSDSRIDLGNANVNKKKSNVTIPKTTIHKPEPSKNNTSSLFDISEHETESDSSIDLANAYVNKKKSNVTIPKTTIHKPEPSKNNTSSLFDISEHETESDSSIDLANAYVNKNKSNVTVPKTTIHKPEHSKNNTSSLFEVSEHETKSDSRIDLGNANVNKNKSNVTVPKTTIHKPEHSKNNTSSLFDVSEHETKSDSRIDLGNANVNKNKSNVTVPKTTIHKPEHSKNNTSCLFDVSEHETKSDSRIDLGNANVIPKRKNSSLFDLSDRDNIESNKSSNLIKDTIHDNVLTSNVKTIKQTNNLYLFKEENDNSDGRSISNMKVPKEFIINPKTCEKNLDSLSKNIKTVTRINNIKNSVDHKVEFKETNNYFIPKQHNSSLFDLSGGDDIESGRSSNLIKDTIDNNVLTSNVKTIKLINNVNMFKEKNDNLDISFTPNVKVSKEPCENNFVCYIENINTETKITDIKNSVVYTANFNENKNCTIPKQHNSSLFNFSHHNDVESDSSSDDDCYKLLIDDQLMNSKITDIQIKNEEGVQLMNVNAKITDIQIKNEEGVQLMNVNAKKTNIQFKNEEGVQLINMNAKIMNTQIKNDQDDKSINLINTDTKIQTKNAIKSGLPKKESILCNEPDNSRALKKKKTTLPDYKSFMNIEKCNEFYKKQPLNIGKSLNENEHFSKTVQDIFSEMYVDTIFVSNCKHMVELCDSQLRNVELMNIKNHNYKNKMYKEKCNQPIPNYVQPITETEMNINCKQNNKPLPNPISTLQKLNSSQKQKNISNIQIRVNLREMLKSNQPMNVIFKSTEFKNLSHFCEEEISSTICVLLFENTFNAPKITGLTIFGVNCEEMNNEEKNKLLGSTNLNITCPKIMKLTSITLELVKTLQSDRLINMILNSIRNNILNKKINLNNKTDHQLIIQTLYLVDICNRLGMLKYIQTFIWDSIVLLPNKYCCVIFMSLMLWNNCLPVKLNNEQDPVIIMALSYLIAKRKLYSHKINIDATVDHNIYQQELTNLLSFYYNYSFTVDLPINLIKHRHKPDFFPSVMMILKCSYAKDMVEFTTHCLFPIIEQYLNTQQDESYAIQTMELIFHSFRLFRFSYRPTVTGYLSSRKSTENNFDEDKTSTYITLYQSYKTLLNKMIEYINDSRPRSQYFEEMLVSIVMLLGCVDYCTCCAVLMKWEPKFEPSSILTRKYDIFKSILGHTLWNRLCVIDDINTIKCLINVCTLGDEFYHTLEKLR